MARYALGLIAALVAQECVAAPMAIPTPLLPSFSLSGIPLPTGAFIDKPAPFKDARGEDLPLPTSLPFTLPSLSLPPPLLPTGGPAEKRQEFSSLSVFPGSLLPSSTNSGSQLPGKREEALPTLPLPPLPFSLPFSLPTGIPTGSPTPSKEKEKRQEFFTLSELPSFTLNFPTPTGSLLPKREQDFPTPTLPFSLPTGLPTGLTIPLEQKRQEFLTFSKFPSFTASIPTPTGSLRPKREEDLPTPTLPFSLPTGLPTGLSFPFRG